MKKSNNTPSPPQELEFTIVTAEELVKRDGEKKTKFRRACFTCRKAKKKCSGGRPCTRCAKLNRPASCIDDPLIYSGDSEFDDYPPYPSHQYAAHYGNDASRSPSPIPSPCGTMNGQPSFSQSPSPEQSPRVSIGTRFSGHTVEGDYPNDSLQENDHGFFSQQGHAQQRSPHPDQSCIQGAFPLVIPNVPMNQSELEEEEAYIRSVPDENNDELCSSSIGSSSSAAEKQSGFCGVQFASNLLVCLQF